MADTAAPVATPKAAKKKAAAKPKKPAMHPKYSEMIRAAVSSLKERRGSSRQAILKYVKANYKVGDEKAANVNLKRALKAGVKNGALKQSKGTGASGSFKLGETKKVAKSKKATNPKATKPKRAAKPKKPAVHPKYSEMIQAAVSSFNERGGSSRQAILKYVMANYKVGDEKTANIYLKRALNAGVKNGALKQSKGSGASGSFKLGEMKKSTKPKKATNPKAAKPKRTAKPKKPAVHSKYSDMIQTAVSSLKERGGSSRQAILKYVMANYKVGDEKAANVHLKRAIKAGVKNGVLKQSKGTGASVSFKLGETKKAAKPKKANNPKAAKPKRAKSLKKARTVTPIGEIFDLFLNRSFLR